MSNLVPCPDCGSEVSRLARACPKCGRPFPRKTWVGWKVIQVIGALPMLASAVLLWYASWWMTAAAFGAGLLVYLIGYAGESATK